MRKKILILLIWQATALLATAQKITDNKYVFPVKPGSAAWRAFTTHKQMEEATQLPQNVLTSLTTKALLETCLDYPLLIDMMAYNTPQKGLEAVARNFNGLQELIKRNDVATHLANVYQQLITTDINKLSALSDKGKLSFQLSFIEILFGQKPVLGKIDKGAISSLKTHITRALAYKTSHSDVFSAVTNSYTLFFAGNLYYHFYRSEFTPAAHDFLRSGSLKDTSVIEEITKAIQ
ncbi:MAG: hypothetical protein J7621_02945 [Niastella sp.]|nr:hypothetical protein [Niastella sp.]